MSKSSSVQDLINLSCYCDVYRKATQSKKSRQEAEAKIEAKQSEVISEKAQSELCQQR